MVAGISVNNKRMSVLRKLGVRDSKALAPKRREALYERILETCSRVYSVHIPPSEIDQAVRSGVKYRKLNYLEALYFAKVIDRLGVPRVIVDASDSSPERFGEVISEHLSRKCKVVSRHKADSDYPVVSAASIVAKVERDRAVKRLRRKIGDFGSGYPSDPVTRSFFINRLRRGVPLPPDVRKSWKSWESFKQTLLTET